MNVRCRVSLVVLTLLAGCADDPVLEKDDAAARFVEFNPKPLSIDRDKPVSIEQAVQFVLDFQPGWKKHQVDKNPLEILGNRKAHRVVFVRPFLRHSQGQLYVDPEPSDFKDDIWEFVLVVDDGKEVTDDEKRKIEWSDVWRPGERQPINLGRGYGFVWITNSTLKEQNKIRPLLNLDGGDDEMKLLVAGMHSEDRFTRQDCALMLDKFGDEALPHLEKLLTMKPPLRGGKPDWSWNELIVSAIARVRTPKGTELLLKLYKSDDKRLHQWIYNGLTKRPFRPEAKEAYLEMLDERTRKGGGGHTCGQACVELGLKEAIPMFDRVRKAPWSLHAYTDAVQSIRRLSGNPYSDELYKTVNIAYEPKPGRENGKQRQEDLGLAKQVLTTNDDIDGAILLVIKIYTHQEVAFKRALTDDQLDQQQARREFAVEVLRAMPDDRGLAEVKRLAKLLPKDKRLQELADALSKN